MAKELGTAGKLIEKGWCQGTFAKSAEGVHVQLHSADAACWCSAGALLKSYPDKRQAEVAFNKLICEVASYDEDPFGITDWNDDPARTKEEVLEVFRKAGV